ncbi:unnamed protein product, partial [marine sediment metagenome]
MLLRILEQENPDYLAVAFDTGRTFRDELYSEYKATRAKMPDDLRPQIERIRQLVDAFNIPRLELEGYEADDVLGSVAHQAVEHGLGVKIITGDRDLLQLVNERVIVTLPGKSLSDSKDYIPKDVIETLGVRPDQVVDYKALVGDKSDNIPGVAGIGPKTAVSLLGSYDDLDGVYAHLDDLSPNLQKKFVGGVGVHPSRSTHTTGSGNSTMTSVSCGWDEARCRYKPLQSIVGVFSSLAILQGGVICHKLPSLSPQSRKTSSLVGSPSW